MKKRIQKQRHDGFTIVELIVVIAVIGILATISIVSYSNVRKDAARNSYDATAQQIKLKLGGYYTDNNHYPQDKDDVQSYLSAINAGSTLIDEFDKTNDDDEDIYDYKAYTDSTASTQCASDAACQYYEITVDKDNWDGDSDIVVKP